MNKDTSDVRKRNVTNEDIYQLLQAVNAKNIEMEKRLERIETNFSKEIEQVNKKVRVLEDENKQLKKELQQTQKKQKKYNIVIYGMNETESDLYKNTLEIITTKLGVPCEQNEIRDIYRLGKVTDTNKSRPVLIELLSYLKKQHILKNATKLKGTGLYIRSDLTPEEIKDNRILVKHLQQAREMKHNARIHKNQLIINGEIYTVEDLIGDEVQLTNNNSFSVQDIPSVSKGNSSSAPATPDAIGLKENTGRKLRSNFMKNREKKSKHTRNHGQEGE